MLERASGRVSCRLVDAWLVAYLKGGLPPRRRRAVDEHLAGCEACRRAVRDARALESGLRLEAARDNPTLSPMASARIQERVYRRMRRGLIVQRTSRVVGGAVGVVAALILVAVGFLLWQQRQVGLEVTPSPAQEDAIVITFACSDSDRLHYENLVQIFEEANPDLHVQLVSLDDVLGPPQDGQYVGDVGQRLATAADTLAISPDLEMVQRGLLRDLTPFFHADQSFDAQDFYPGTLEALQWDNGTWGLPTNVWSFRLIFYDKEAFNAAKVPYPKSGWTWDDFLNTAEALTERQGADVLRWGFVDRVSDPTPFVQGRVIDGLGSDLDQSTITEAMQWYTDLILVHQVMPPPDLASAQGDPMASEAAQLIGTGRAAMWSESTLLWDYWSTGRQIGVVPYPVDDPTSATTPIRLSAVVMSSGTTHPEHGWRWLEFLSRQQPVGGQLPARSSVAESSGYWASLETDRAVTYRYALSHALSPVKGSLASGLDPSDLQDVVQSILAGKQNLGEILPEGGGQDVADGKAIEKVATVAVATAEPEVTPDSDKQKIVFIPRDPGKTGMYRDLAAEFNRAHPNSIVEIVPDIAGGGTMRTGHELLPVLTQNADCFIDVWQTWYPEDQAYLLALDPLMEADTGFSLDDFYAPAMEVVRLQGHFLAIPQSILPRMMFYRKSLFDDAELEYPTPEWTLDDFLTLAVALTGEEEGRRQYGYLGSPDNSDASFFLEQYGAQPVELSKEPVAYQFDAPLTIEAVRWYVALGTEHEIMPVPEFGPLDLDRFLDAQRSWVATIKSDQTAMWSDFSPNTLSLISDARTEAVDMVPMPQGRGYVADFLLKAFYISARTQHPEVCWEWIKFLTEQSSGFLDAQDGLPPRRSVAASAVYRQRVGDDVATLYQKTMEDSERSGYARLVANRPDVSYPFLWFDEAVRAVIDGQDVSMALGEAQRKAEAYVVCLQTKHGVEGEELARACALEIDPDFYFYGSD
jgi:ABC-type glycerol-3-phosphate transport system substrate-binding protein